MAFYNTNVLAPNRLALLTPTPLLGKQPGSKGPAFHTSWGRSKAPPRPHLPSGQSSRPGLPCTALFSAEKATRLALGKGLARFLVLGPGHSLSHLPVPGSGAWRGGRGPLGDQNYNWEKQHRTATDHRAPHPRPRGRPSSPLPSAPELSRAAGLLTGPGFAGSLYVPPGGDHHVLSSLPSTPSTFSKAAAFF